MILDKTFIRKIKRHHRKSELELYKNYFSYWMNIAMNYYKNEEDAALCINDSFIKICNNITKYDQKHSFSTWTKTILTRTILDDLRKTKKYRETMMSKEDIELMNVSYEIVGENEIDVSSPKYSVKSAMSELPEATKKVFSMFIIDGYSHSDIADELGITVNTSKWHVKTGKQKIKEILLSKYKK